MTDYTFDWFSRNITTWSLAMRDLIAKPKLSFLEIGAFEGMSTNWLLKNVLTDPTSRIMIIDTFTGSMEHPAHGVSTANLLARFQANTKEFEDKIRILKGRSQELLKTLFNNTFDLIYIDGSHKASDVIQDIVLSWPLLKKDGILIMDDYDWRFYQDKLLLPYPAIDSFLDLYADQYELLEKNVQVIVRKKV